MKNLLKFGDSINGLNHFIMSVNQNYPCMGIDTMNESNIYISEDPSQFILMGNPSFHFTGSRYYGNGQGSTNVTGSTITLDQLISGQTTFTLNLTPHVLSLYVENLGESNYLYANGTFQDGQINLSDVVLPVEVTEARYTSLGTIWAMATSLNQPNPKCDGWSGSIITIYSYNGEPESFDDIPTFQEGQQITFNLTMKRPNGEVILDNKAITLNFT